MSFRRNREQISDEDADRIINQFTNSLRDVSEINPEQFLREYFLQFSEGTPETLADDIEEVYRGVGAEPLEGQISYHDGSTMVYNGDDWLNLSTVETPVSNEFQELFEGYINGG